MSILEIKLENKEFVEKAKKIKLVLTDNDGVLTDTGVYYSVKGEELKRFSIRDGMGMVRLRDLLKIETGIVTGETSGSVKKRAEKLKLKYVYLGVDDKNKELDKILIEHNIKADNIAYIGDDVNDIEIIKRCGFTASPNDAIDEVQTIVDYICKNKGGNGAFREFAELIIALKS